MRSRLLLLVGGLGLACSSPNPAYEDSGPTGAVDTSEGTSVGDSTAGSTSVTPLDTTSTITGAVSTTTEDTSEDLTDSGPPPPGCDAPPPPSGTVCHQPDPVDIPQECIPRPVYVADIDDDGLGDVLVGCEGGPLLVLRGEPGGVGEPEPLGEAGPAPQDIAVGQLDGESGVDVVVVNDVFTNGVRVFYDEGDGTYTLELYDPAARPTSVAVGAWYEHELPDIMVADPILGQIVRLQSMGPRAYVLSPPLSIISGHPHDVALGQLDGDGGVDLAIASQGASKLTVIFNTGNGGESQPLDFSDTPITTPNRLLIDDVDQDGSVDILYTRGGSSALKVFRGLGGGMFDPSATVYGVEVRGLGGGDFDANGYRDTVLADHGSDTIIFVMRSSSDTPEVTTRSVGGPPWSIATGMIDGDAMTDVVVSVEGTNELVLGLSAP